MQNAHLKLLILLLSLSLLACSSSKKDLEPQLLVEAVDTPEEELLNQAMSLYDRGLFKLSRDHWMTLRNSYPSSPYALLAELKIADSFFFQEDYESAIIAYEEFIRLHPAHEALAYAQFQIGRSYYLQSRGAGRDQTPLRSAALALEKLKQDYPKSYYAIRANKMLDKSSESTAQHEFDVAHFYIRQRDQPAAHNRLERIFRDYKDTDLIRTRGSELAEFYQQTFAQAAPELVIQAEISAEEITSEPAAPQVLLAKQQLPKQEAKIEPLIIAKENAITTPLQISNETRLVSLECKSNAELDSYIFQSQSVLEIVRSNSSDTQHNFQVRANSKIHLPIKVCSLDKSALRIEQAEAGFLLTISHERAFEVVGFTLDRPNRLIFTLQPKS